MGIIPSLVQTTELRALALAQAKRWLKEGRVREAMDLELDVARYGEDIAMDGVSLSQSIGFQFMQEALQAFLGTLRLPG
jgi:hypothetical protein